MEIYKFGGASVVDTNGIKNVKDIIEKNNRGKKIIIVSALGKTTNALEEVVEHYINDNQKYLQFLREIRAYHIMVAEELFPSNHKVIFKLFALFDSIELFCSNNKKKQYTYIYDQIICVGELASTTLLSEYLNYQGIENIFLDVRKLIRTDDHYTDAKVDWDETNRLITENEQIQSDITIITQGFIASTDKGVTTTLGREGSDFTGAIFAFVLQAKKLTIWKDVDGIYSSDPNVYEEAVFLEKLSYREATEMTYYGAKVIHPKTIRPLQNRKISLEVRSFLNPNNGGTIIQESLEKNELPPIIVYKEQQILLSFTSKDFSFTEAENLRIILKSFDDNRLKINAVHTGAITLSVVVDNNSDKIELIKEELQESFKIKFNNNLSLITIRHYDFYTEDLFLRNKEILLEQRTRETLQVLIRDSQSIK